jgi:CHAD domain-containing protein
MIAESDVTADPAQRRLVARLLKQGAEFDRLAGSPRTGPVVHQLRVLTRRMRAICSVVRRLSDPDPARILARRLRRIGRALGVRRTLDVAATDYASLSGGKPLPGLEGLKAAADAKLDRRLRARRRLAVGEAVRELAESLRTAAPDPEALERFLRSRLESLRKDLGAATKKELHALRIDAKKARYALEIARTLGRRDLAPVERSLKRLQRRLGRIHDLEAVRGLIPARDPVAVRAASREATQRAGVRPLRAALKAVFPGRRP